MKTALVFVAALAVATPLAAQTRRSPRPRTTTPSVSLRPLLVVTAQRFAAAESFKAVFGRPLQPFFGGGLDVAFRGGLYIDATASRFKKTGQRAFQFNGRLFGLGVPLTVTETPLEVTAGYRHQAPRSRVVPYVGGGVGIYRYQEAAEGNDPSENMDLRHAGYLAVGGVEFRVNSWVGVSGDLQYTRVPGILGANGISKEVNENNLGGVAFRFRTIIGR